MYNTDGDGWKAQQHDEERFFQEARNLLIGLCVDGVSPFAISPTAFSMMCLVFQLYNIPADLRKTYENLLIWGIMEGKGKPDLVFRVLAEDLAVLWRGVSVFDKFW